MSDKSHFCRVIKLCKRHESNFLRAEISLHLVDNSDSNVLTKKGYIKRKNSAWAAGERPLSLSAASYLTQALLVNSTLSPVIPRSRLFPESSGGGSAGSRTWQIQAPGARGEPADVWLPECSCFPVHKRQSTNERCHRNAGRRLICVSVAV